MLKIYTAHFKLKPLDVLQNVKNAEQELEKACSQNADIAVFTTAFLSGCPLGIMQSTNYFADIYNEQVDLLCKKYMDKPIYIICDNLIDTSFTTVCYHKGIKAFADTIETENGRIKVFNSSAKLFKAYNQLAKTKAVGVLNWSEPIVAGERELKLRGVKTIAEHVGMEFILNLGGWGFTSHPNFYMACLGKITKHSCEYSTDYRQQVLFERLYNASSEQVQDEKQAFSLPHTEFAINFNENPLIPSEIKEKAYCRELFDMQSASLAARMDNIGCKKVVLALSGGLDSTLAFLVALNTFDMLNLDKSGIQVISMPGFGTSDTTKSLAQNMCQQAGVACKMIDITKSCRQALQDIGHDNVTTDITFENVQARMRTLNALNLANKTSAIMLGTGDLSEEAVGFSTYGGDQLASYNVNSCISKTVIRTMLAHILTMPIFDDIKNTVEQVLNIPVSPELVPHGNKILQKTEEILAPYKLIDFFLYCFVIAQISPKETVEKAFMVFKGEFDKNYITEKLNMFYKRFVMGQFKRSCAPEGAKISHISLSNLEYYIPSDASYSVFSTLLK